MHHPRKEHVLAVFLSVTLHALVLALAGTYAFRQPQPPEARPEENIVFLEMAPAPPEAPSPEPPPPAEALAPEPLPAPAAAITLPSDDVPPPATERERAYMAAPPAPTAQEWALASTYKLKNSKRYRYTWGQQVRSMMGTAFEGADQGEVRFLVEIAPDGTLSRLETLWSTSPAAEQLARKAIQNMPPLPPTPTGKPLVFEKTISFQPFATDDPPVYKDDCLPDRPAFRNPYAWDGRSDQGPAVQPATEKMDAQALEECLKQLPQDSIEAESANDRRQLEQWRSQRLGR
ncbi:energy transducer TonB family protein [Hydrogenophaga aquatica]